MDPVKAAGTLLVIGAVLLLIGTISKSWFTLPFTGRGEGGADIAIGPRGVQACVQSVCKDKSIFDLPAGGRNGLPNDIYVFAIVAIFAGFASAALAGLYGGAALSGRRYPVLPPRVGQIVFSVAGFSMSYFFFRMLTDSESDLHELTVSWAGIPAIGGAVLAGAGIVKLRKAASSAPPMQQLPHSQVYGQYGGQQAMAQQSQPMPYPQQQAAPQHACPRCGTQLHWVQQYQRWFCPREQQYV